MSVRLNTALAYVIELDKLPFDEDSLDDVLLKDVKKEVLDKTLIELKLDEIYFKHKFTLDDFVRIYNSENFPNIKNYLLVFFPGVPREWHRLSDNLDSYLIKEEEIGTIKYLNEMVFPFDENKVVKSTLKEIEYPYKSFLSDPWNIIDPKVKDHFISKGIKADKPAFEQTYMKATPLVQVLAKYLNFSDKQILKLQMARLIYTT